MIVFDDLIGRPTKQKRVVQFVTSENKRDPLITLAVEIMLDSEHEGVTDIYFYENRGAIKNHAYHMRISGVRGGGLSISGVNPNERIRLMETINS